MAVAETRLADEYENIDEELPDVLALSSTTQTVHRAHGDGASACGTLSADESRVVPAESVGVAGRLCRKCWAQVFDFLADRDDSPVRRRDAKPAAAVEDATDELPWRPAENGITALDSLTETVLVDSGQFHAPAGGQPLCGTNGAFRTAAPEALRPHHGPCGNCFSLTDE
jgi:hypothetical protein